MTILIGISCYVFCIKCDLVRNGSCGLVGISQEFVFWCLSMDLCLDAFVAQGLRHRHPLSPYLFVIVMQALSCLINRARMGGFLTGWMVRGRSEEVNVITHLLVC